MSEELEHSSLGPSGAHRWRRCAGSVNAERGRPDNVRIEAAEGTVFHDYAAMAVEFDLEPDSFPLGVEHLVDGYKITFNQEMIDNMHDGLAWIRERLEPGDILIVEKKVSIERWAGPGQFGTSDCCIIQVRRRRMIVFDWKYGKGVPVSPIKNDQCYLYGLGCWAEFAEALFEGVEPADIEVVFYIEQPRASGGGGEWTTTMADLLAEGELIKEDANATRDPFAPRTPGPKQCEFCKASGDCKEQAEWLLDHFSLKFDEVIFDGENGLQPVLPDPHKLPPEVRSSIILMKKTFTKFLDKVHELTLLDLKQGRDVPIIKAVNGKAGRRYYSDAAGAKEALVEAVGPEKALEVKPITPAAAEKILGKKRYGELLKQFVDQYDSKPIIVHQDDPRLPIQDFASKFESLKLPDEDEDETGED